LGVEFLLLTGQILIPGFLVFQLRIQGFISVL